MLTLVLELHDIIWIIYDTYKDWESKTNIKEG